MINLDKLRYFTDLCKSEVMCVFRTDVMRAQEFIFGLQLIRNARCFVCKIKFIFLRADTWLNFNKFLYKVTLIVLLCDVF